MKRQILLIASCLIACPTRAQTVAGPARTPIETIVVIASRSSQDPLVAALEPSRDGRLATLSDLFRTAPGIIVEPVFGGDEQASGYRSGSWFKLSGFRDHNAEEAWRTYANASLGHSKTVEMKASFLWSDSRLQLPSPQTLAQIASGNRSAKPGNVGAGLPSARMAHWALP